MVLRKQSKTGVERAEYALQRHTLNNLLPSTTPHFSVSITSKNITTIWRQGILMMHPQILTQKCTGADLPEGGTLTDEGREVS